MAHAAARRRGDAGDEADHRLLGLVVLDEVRRVFFRRAADLADHDDGLGFRIAQEHLQHLDMLGALDRIAADADAGGLAEADRRRLRHRFIGQRAGARHDADLAAAMDVAGHDADLAFAGRDHAGTVRSDETRLRALQRALYLHHVEHRDALGDADGKRNLRVDRFEDRIGRIGRRHIDRRRGCAGRLARLAHRVEHGQAEMRCAAFAGRSAADHLGAIGDGLLGMEGALVAGEALGDDLGVLVDENGHFLCSFTALTIFCAASARSLAETMGRPDSARIFLPSSTLVPSRRTTSGTFSEISFAAATMPSAMMSHFMMPPKMLTRMPFTFGSETMILNAAVTFSLLAPPPTSRKFAGSSP